MRLIMTDGYNGTKNIRSMAQTEQEKLIGVHPVAPHIFGLWWSSTDMPTTDRKKHRKLEEDPTVRNAAIDQLAQWIVDYHVTDFNLGLIARQKAILNKHDLGKYIDQLHLLPKADTTQKGNLGEIVLIEYLKGSRAFTPYVHKLHYNPNTEQSMKGDDVLMFDPKNLNSEVIYGECKFRGKPTAGIVGEIVGNLEGLKKLPVSLNFVANRVNEMGDTALAEQIVELQAKIYNGEVPVTNVGFLISKSSARKGCGTSAIVEDNLDTSNPRLVMISLGVDDPVDIVTQAFQKAEALLKT